MDRTGHSNQLSGRMLVAPLNKALAWFMRIGNQDELDGQTGNYCFAFGIARISRTSIINHLIKKNNYKSYLEIGVRDRENFDLINIEHKTAVDPEPLCEVDCRMTSDEFFHSIEPERKFDLIFIDGLHLHAQVRKDIANALSHLSANGTVVVHDCNPPTAFHQRENYEVDGEYPAWSGTVWKSWVELRCFSADLSMAVVNTDWGVGVIQRGTQKCYAANPEAMTYQDLEVDRKAMLNLISVEEFLKRY